MNSKQKGDLAVSSAIKYFTHKFIQVLLPLGDKQRYDLVVDDNGTFKRIQCKYTSCKSPYSLFIVPLRTMGGNRTRLNSRKYLKSDFDLLFIMTSDNTYYLIPFPDVKPTTSMNLDISKDIYKVSL